MAGLFEVEVKSLLGGDTDKVEALRTQLADQYPHLERKPDQQQLNHYFKSNGDINALIQAVSVNLTKEQVEVASDLIGKAQKYSLRTREINHSEVILVLKLSIGDGTSVHGVARKEFEASFDMTIGELDAIILRAGFTYQSKWSRERETYSDDATIITIDKNGGYGYLVEVEKVTDDESAVPELRTSIFVLMEKLRLVELPQDRLEKMFSFYNENWNDYYGTEKTFTIE